MGLNYAPQRILAVQSVEVQQRCNRHSQTDKRRYHSWNTVFATGVSVVYIRTIVSIHGAFRDSLIRAAICICLSDYDAIMK